MAHEEKAQNPVFSQLSTNSVTSTMENQLKSLKFIRSSMIRFKWEGVSASPTLNGGKGGEDSIYFL